MEKTVREVVTENRKTAAQMQNRVEQAGNKSRAVYFELLRNPFKEYSGTGRHDRETAPILEDLDVATAVSAVALSLLVCAVFWKLAV